MEGKRKKVHLAVIGTGPIGLEAAAWARTRGYGLTVLERQSEIGGDWLRWGNDWSRLQSHRDSYLFSGPVSVPEEDDLPAYPSRAQILKYFKAYAVAAGVWDCIRFEATVTERSAVGENGAVRVSYIDSDSGTQFLEVSHVFCAPGRVNKRRIVPRHPPCSVIPKHPPCSDPSPVVPPTPHVAWGTSNDLADFEFAGKRVVVVGHGSFAIENARHALEEGAASVVLLARHQQLVMSRAAGLFVDRNVDRTVPASAVLEALRSPYRLIGWSSEQLEEEFYGKSRATMLPTSDFYFAARAAGRLTVAIGEIQRVGESCVETKCGVSLPAELVIKCVGFTPDKQFDAAMKPDMKKEGRVSVFHQKDSARNMNSNTPFGGGSGGARHFSPFYGFISMVEGLPACDLSASNNVLRSRVAERSRTKQPLEEFMAEQEQDWRGWCELLGVSMDYLYCLQDLLAWEELLHQSPVTAAPRGIPFNQIAPPRSAQ